MTVALWKSIGYHRGALPTSLVWTPMRPAFGGRDFHLRGGNFSSVAKRIAFSTILACLWPSVGFAETYPMPNELALGLGIPRDHTVSEWTGSLVLTLSMDYFEDSRIALVLEGEALGFSEAETCRQNDSPDTCVDAALLAGVRVRRPPHLRKGVKPYLQVLAGSYWKGSGVEGQDHASNHFAMQLGGGLEFRWAGSIQGLRMSLDYRHVFADRDRKQTRVLFAYVLGPRRFV